MTQIDLEKKIPDIGGLVKKERVIPGISGLATSVVLTAVENRIPDVSHLVKKTDYEAKILDIESFLLQLIIKN